MGYKKIQFYMAADQDEYNKALAWVRRRDDVERIKEVGYMPTTDWVGNDMDTYVFVFSAPNEVMKELATDMNQPYKEI